MANKSDKGFLAYLKSRPIAAWIVIAWMILWLIFALRSADWKVMLGFFMLFLPLYWQVYLKKDLAPSWW